MMNQTRPWNLYSVIEHLQENYWCGEILSRLQQHFPNSQAFAEPELDWLKALRWLLTEMDDQWFPINWDMVSEHYAWSQQDESMVNELMPPLWRAIPIKHCGICLDDHVEIREIWHSYPSLCLMFLLLEPNNFWLDDILPNDFLEVDYFGSGRWIDDEGDDPQKYHRAFLGCDDFGWLLEPLLGSEAGLELAAYLREPLGEWLPTVAQIVNEDYHSNLFLHPMVDVDVYGRPPLYDWDFVESLQQQWEAAKPTAQKLEQFDSWISGIPPEYIKPALSNLWHIEPLSNLAVFTHILEKGMPLWKQDIW